MMNDKEFKNWDEQVEKAEKHNNALIVEFEK